MSKRLLNHAFAGGMAEALDAEGMAQTVNTGTADTKEAFRAFFHKQTPKFTGR
jgi:hypothetical protein